MLLSYIYQYQQQQCKTEICRVHLNTLISVFFEYFFLSSLIITFSDYTEFLHTWFFSGLPAYFVRYFVKKYVNLCLCSVYCAVVVGWPSYWNASQIATFSIVAYLLWHRDSNVPNGRSATHQKYIRYLVLRWSCNDLFSWSQDRSLFLKCNDFCLCSVLIIAPEYLSPGA